MSNRHWRKSQSEDFFVKDSKLRGYRSRSVYKLLEKMGMEKQIRDHVFTSGEAALNYLKKFYLLEKFYHIGPPRDFDLFNEFKNDQSKDLDNCKYLLLSPKLFKNGDVFRT